MNTARQEDLAAVFQRSQTWVSRMQSRSVDPMPKDEPSARAWGVRNGYLGGHVAPTTDASPPDVSISNRELADIKLKQLRADEIELRMQLSAGTVLLREDVERRAKIDAAEMRRMALDYPTRARAVLDRHIQDAALVRRVVADLEPLAAELLNRADPHRVLQGVSSDELRAILMQRVEELCQAHR